MYRRKRSVDKCNKNEEEREREMERERKRSGSPPIIVRGRMVCLKEKNDDMCIHVRPSLKHHIII